jgi:hypothetical protein
MASTVSFGQRYVQMEVQGREANFGAGDGGPQGLQNRTKVSVDLQDARGDWVVMSRTSLMREGVDGPLCRLEGVKRGENYNRSSLPLCKLIKRYVVQGLLYNNSKF